MSAQLAREAEARADREGRQLSAAVDTSRAHAERERTAAGRAAAERDELGAEADLLRADCAALRAALADLSQAARAREAEASDARDDALASRRELGAAHEELHRLHALADERAAALQDMSRRQRQQARGLTSALASLSQQLHGAAEPDLAALGIRVDDDSDLSPARRSGRASASEGVARREGKGAG